MKTCLTCLRQSLVAGTLALFAGAALLFGAAIVTFAIFRFVDPPTSSLMASQRLQGKPVDQRWIPLSQVSPNLVLAVVSSEDARFCRHLGIDMIELRNAVRRSKSGEIGAVRGASTISMQVVKNLVLWPDRSLVRKGLEMVVTPVMEAIWPKRRILEVYMNIAEWGPGVFGAEAASRHHFGKPASQLTRREAALLAATLPNPRVRRPSRPTAGLYRRAARIVQLSRKGRVNISCLGESRIAAR